MNRKQPLGGVLFYECFGRGICRESAGVDGTHPREWFQLKYKTLNRSSVGIALLREVLSDCCVFFRHLIMRWPWGTTFVSSCIKRSWWQDNRLLQVLTNTYVTIIKKSYAKLLQIKDSEKRRSYERFRASQKPQKPPCQFIFLENFTASLSR